MAITFVSDGIEGALATFQNPVVAQGSWLQVYVSKEGGEMLLRDLNPLLKKAVQHFSLPTTFKWEELHLKVTVVA